MSRDYGLMRYTKSSTVQMFRIIEGRDQGQIAGVRS